MDFCERTPMTKSLGETVQERSIKRFIRSKESREYFKNGEWTSNPDEANSFSDVVEAAEICARYGLNNVEVALRFDSCKSDVFCTNIR
jgi:hypothetical protein